MIRRLLEANLNDDAAAIIEVESLMHEIKAAWDALGSPGIAPQAQNAPRPESRFDAAV